MHGCDAEKTRRENDCRLMDCGVNINHTRAINRHLHKFRWMSDVCDEIGTAWNEAAQAVADTEWREAIQAIERDGDTVLGRWWIDTDPQEAHANRLRRAKLAYRDTRVKLDDGSWGAICAAGTLASAR